ncbi:CaiB/BaiF CoA transferase family protein [Cupriavidus lacunae]|uniref:CoA transferase n=1 Tax=Cupriavidus lacunae TaxID=2666307 RepID=A0A370NJH3_9BURK|nr:CoA transferase [Cupriavidus lacunae]RDK05728.1 CoA transferase [Cupriavidus lacunae]
MLRDSLEGVRVLDFSHVLAGPVCTMMLADLGAHVVKIEPPNGEIGRSIGPPWIHGESAIHLSVNRNKDSLAIDLKTDAGRQAIRQMVRCADVVVENFRPGVMASLGLDYETLARVNPRLVYCSISAFGQTGSSRSRPGVDGIIQAVSGLMSTLGEAGSDPLKIPVPVADMVTGYLATIAVLGALHKTRHRETGQYLDISLYNATIMLQQIGFASYFASGVEPEKAGSAAPYAAPNEAFPTADGWLMVAAYHPDRWTALCDVLDVRALETDPRFAANADRVRNRTELHKLLSQRFMKRNNVEWIHILTARDILCAPVSSYGDVVGSQEYRDSGIDLCVDHPIAGKVRMPGFALGPSDRSVHQPRPAPMAGQHSAEVLAAYGVPSQSIAELLARGIIRTVS